jgi:uncharacterized protein (DUF1684 family)
MKLFVFRQLVISVFLFFAISCSQSQPQDSTYVNSIKEYREKTKKVFIDPEKSPLKPEQRKNFVGLNYYPISEEFVFEAEFIATPDEIPFKMKTTTEREPDYIKKGVLRFTYRDSVYSLNAYQQILSPMMAKSIEPYLFVPFIDESSGFESYGGGRYLELAIPTSNTVIVDFNKAYNPYCAYNAAYSCPLPPAENFLAFKVLAGERNFK